MTVLALALHAAWAAPPADALPGRDAYGVPNAATSAHFALRWGYGLDEAQAQANLALLEQVWEALVDGQGYPPPVGADEALFNVYVGSSGGGTPSGRGVDAWYGYDPEGWPMVVLSLDVAQDPQTWGGVAAHELVHALQDGAGRPYNTPDTSWWWEAHAVWLERHLFPEKDAWARFAWAYILAPELALGAPGDGAYTPEGLHPWGAALWPIWLDEVLGLAPALHQSWIAPGEDPLEGLRAALEEQGLSLEDSFLAFQLDLGRWEVGDMALLQQSCADARRQVPGQDRRITQEFQGTMSPAQAEESTLPQPWGANRLALRAPEGGPDLELRFTPAGDPADWRLGLVLWRDGVAQGEVLEGWAEGPLTRAGAGDVDRAELLAVFVPADPQAEPGYTWSLSAMGAQDTGLEAPPQQRCGCAGGSAAGLGVLLWGRRRRRPAGGGRPRGPDQLRLGKMPLTQMM